MSDEHRVNLSFIGWQPPTQQPGAAEMIVDRLEELEEKGWSSRELWDLDPEDTRHGHHGLVYVLKPGWRIGRIGRALVELLGPPDGNRVRSRLVYTRRRIPELLLDPVMAQHLRHEQQRVAESTARYQRDDMGRVAASVARGGQ